MKGQKHLVACRCILHQFKNSKNPPQHHFVVFSLLDDNDNVVSKYVQCNNCGIVHRVSELCKSQIVGSKEDLKHQMSLEEIKKSLGQQLSEYLDSNEADRATYEMCKFVVDNERWGERVVVSSERIEQERHGKVIRIMSREFHIIDEFVEQTTIGDD